MLLIIFLPDKIVGPLKAGVSLSYPSVFNTQHTAIPL